LVKNSQNEIGSRARSERYPGLRARLVCRNGSRVHSPTGRIIEKLGCLPGSVRPYVALLMEIMKMVGNINMISPYPQRCSMRLKAYDYRQIGAYFVTIGTNNKEHLFGEIEDGKMILNNLGEIVQKEWLRTPIIRTNIQIDECVIMPNHVHGIILIENESTKSPNSRGAPSAPVTELTPAPVTESIYVSIPTSTRTPGSLGSIIAGFKSAVTKKIKSACGESYLPIWQRNYYEYIIRNDMKLKQCREYILQNPMKWNLDREYYV
jgi:REP-associated tyrosine transposase